MGFDNGRVLRVSLKAIGPSEREAVNTFHYDLEDVAVDPDNDPQTLADLFRDNVRPAFAALFQSNWQIDPVSIIEEKDPIDPNAARAGWTSGAVIAGTRVVSGDELPYGVCGVCSLRTAHIGRRFRGRLFLPGQLMESDQANNLWQSGILSLWATYVNAVPVEPDLATGPSGATAKWSVYSRTQRGSNLDPYLSKVTSHSIDTAVHFLRSRRS